MKIVFTLLELLPEGTGGFYSDLAEEFSRHGHEVTIIAPALEGQKTGIYQERGMRVMRVRTMESQNVKSTIKKGISLSLMPYRFKSAYKTYLNNEKFDVVFMPTPPVTFVDFVRYVKRKAHAKFYLILRDIHPHSARSIGMCDNPFMYRFLYNKAQKAYRAADYIGCMSPGNIEFVKTIAPNTPQDKILLLPNWLNCNEYNSPDLKIREKYNLAGKVVALFGGTIGVGQGVWNITNLAENYRDNQDIVFLVVGRGVRKQLLADLTKEARLDNIIFLDYMPREEYEALLATADIGLISLDDRYRVPTCPSKVIGYMSQKIPVFAMINAGSDYGDFYIDRSGCGLWVEALDKANMYASFDKLANDPVLRKKMGEDGYKYYLNNFTTEKIYNTLMGQIQ